ncbi:MAG: PrsW family intramembrane metalloprotease [Thermoplasmata archaeon]
MDILPVILILVLSSFLPPVVYMAWLRNSERFSKEPWGQVFKVFIFGAVFGVIIALILSFAVLYLIGGFVDRIYLFGWDKDIVQTLLIVVIIAPFVEEFAKGVGVYTAHFEITEPEDGLVYGASCGLGFAATENLLYGFLAYTQGGLAVSLVLIGIRSISSALLHASATSILGYGIGRSIVSGGRHRVFPYYLLAVFMHAVFNYTASLQDMFEGEILGVSLALVALVIAIAFALCRRVERL